MAALSVCDRHLLNVAMEQAAKNRGRYLPAGTEACDADVALGLLVRALAHGIVRYCATHELVFDVTGRMQVHLAEHVTSELESGRPPGGGLHS